MSTTIGCPIPGASQPKEPARLIDVDELKKRAMKVCFPDTPECGEFDAVGVSDIDLMPTIDPESLRPTAHWISDSGGSPNVVCSACNAISFAGICAACPLNSDGKSLGCALCNYDTIKVIERTQKLIEWAEKWPRTRQDVFEMYFSDAPMKNGVINICPKKIDKSYKTKCVRDGKPCEQCKKDYWLEGISNGK